MEDKKIIIVKLWKLTPFLCFHSNSSYNLFINIFCPTDSSWSKE